MPYFNQLTCLLYTVGAIVDGLALEGVIVGYSIEATVGAIVDGLALESHRRLLS